MYIIVQCISVTEKGAKSFKSLEEMRNLVVSDGTRINLQSTNVVEDWSGDRKPWANVQSLEEKLLFASIDDWRKASKQALVCKVETVAPCQSGHLEKIPVIY